MTKTINIDGDKHGIGDLAMRLCMAEGYRKKGIPCVFYINDPTRAMLVRDIAGHEVRGGNKPADCFDHIYDFERRWRMLPSRARNFERQMEFGPEPIVPRMRLEQPGLKEWAKSIRKGAEKLAVLFPYSVYKSREWPIEKWKRLAEYLKNGGIRVVLLIEPSKVEEAKKFSVDYYYGFPLQNMLALCAEADLVVGVDSGPAHMAGLMGTKTLVVSGPTKNIFEHYGCVEEMRVGAETLACTGCGFWYPFAYYCDQGCEALDLLPAERVYRRAAEILGGDPIRLPKMVKTRFKDIDREFHFDRNVPGDFEVLDEIYFGDTYCLNDLSVAPKRILDIGGHIGIFARLAGELFPECEIVSVEPCKRNLEMHRKNTERLGKRHRVIEGAVDYREGHLVYWNGAMYPECGSAGFFVCPEKVKPEEMRPMYGPIPDAHRQETQIWTVEQILDQVGWDTVDLIKMDCEGSELNIVENMDFERARPNVLVGEWHENRDRLYAAMRNRLGRGWRLDVIGDGNLGTFRAMRYQAGVPLV